MISHLPTSLCRGRPVCRRQFATCLAALVTITLAMLAAGCRRGVPVEEVFAQAVSIAEAGDTASWNEALAIMRQCMGRDPDDMRIRNFYVICLDRTGNKSEALQMALEYCQTDPGNFLLCYLIGKLYFDRKEFAEAVRYLRQVHNIRPDDHEDSLVLLAICAAELNLADGEEIFQRLAATEAFADSYLLFNDKAVWYLQNGKDQKAANAFTRAVQLSGRNPLVYLNMAIMFDHYHGKSKLALQNYRRFLKTAKDNYPAKAFMVRSRLRALAEGKL